MPKISVVCPAYNHEKFIERMISSVLKQSLQDFELVICDDFSTDSTVSKIEQFSDNRIKLIKHDRNYGINQSINDAFSICSSKYITFLASDDMFYTTHFEKTTSFFNENPSIDVFYCRLTAINENDEADEFLNGWAPIAENNLLNFMFLNENCLLSPGMVVRREAFLKCYPLPLGISQCQDYQMHVDLLLNGKCYQSSEPLVYYRRLKNDANLSASNNATLIRYKYEISSLMDKYLSMTAEKIKNVFSKELTRLNLDVYPETVPFILGRIALLSKHEERRIWGYNQIVKSMETRASADKLFELYKFDFKTLLSLSNATAALFYPEQKRRKGLERLFYNVYRHFEKKRLKKSAIL